MKTTDTKINYKGYLITPKEVFLTKEENDEDYTVAATKTAYQIIDPASGYICATVSSIDRAKKAIDKHGERWRSL
ncbi:hypothetical protein WBJ53_21515 [Spirosoma sp. SC4-14]|uniref:hypothetical protein n=1 Tax=Spirosoma sp. SC4-14 TaxID=3128900 RepID=UPI0030CC6AF6